MATESGRLRLRRDPRGNPAERSIPEFLLLERSLHDRKSRLVPPCLTGLSSRKNYIVVVGNGRLTRCIQSVANLAGKINHFSGVEF